MSDRYSLFREVLDHCERTKQLLPGAADAVEKFIRGKHPGDADASLIAAAMDWLSRTPDEDKASGGGANLWDPETPRPQNEGPVRQMLRRFPLKPGAVDRLTREMSIQWNGLKPGKLAHAVAAYLATQDGVNAEAEHSFIAGHEPPLKPRTVKARELIAQLEQYLTADAAEQLAREWEADIFGGLQLRDIIARLNSPAYAHYKRDPDEPVDLETVAPRPRPSPSPAAVARREAQEAAQAEWATAVRRRATEVYAGLPDERREELRYSLPAAIDTLTRQVRSVDQITPASLFAASVGAPIYGRM